MKSLGDFTIDACYEKRFKWFNDVVSEDGFLLAFEVKAESDAGLVVTDGEEVADTRGEAETKLAMPAYFIRFANYRNSKTLVEKRGQGVVHCVKHDKLLSPQHYVALWVNVRVHPTTISISCGTGSPSRATALLSCTAPHSPDLTLARFGFTSWNTPIEFRNARLHTHPLHEIYTWNLTIKAPSVTPPWGGEKAVVCFGEETFECSRLALLSSGSVFHEALLGEDAETETLFVENREITPMRIIVSNPALRGAEFWSWYRGILRSAVPVSATTALLGTDPHNVAKMQLRYLLATEVFTDISIEVSTSDTTRIGAHRELLLGNEYLANIFTGSGAGECIEADNACLKFSFNAPCESKHMAKALLEALYGAAMGQPFSDVNGFVKGMDVTSMLCFAEECRKYEAHSAVHFVETLLCSVEVGGVEEMLLLCSAASTLPLPRVRKILVANLGRSLCTAVIEDGDALTALPVDMLADTLRSVGNRLETAPSHSARRTLHEFAQFYISANLGDTTDPAAEMWVTELLSIITPQERSISRQPSSEDSIVQENEEEVDRTNETCILPGAVGLFGRLKARNGNPVRCGLVSIATSSPKNPLSSGWKLFSANPKIFCTATGSHPKPFVSATLLGGMVQTATHYELKQGASENFLRGWEFRGRQNPNDEWTVLDRRERQHCLSAYYASAVFEIPPEARVQCSHFQLLRTDGLHEDMTLVQLELYGVLNESWDV